MSTKLDQAAHDAAVLPRIRNLAAANQSLRQIADQLEADGFPSPSGQPQWSYVAVKRILDRAGPPSSESNPTAPAPPLTITVTGPVTAHGPMAVGGGEVTIKVCGPATPASPPPQTDVTAHDPPAKSSLIELAQLGGIFTLPGHHPLYEYLLPAIAARHPTPPADIALHAALYLRRAGR